MSDMSLWTLIQRYVDETGATEASVMRRAGLNKGTFTAWRARGIPTLPKHQQIAALADALKVNYEDVLMAVLHDTKYLPEEVARVLGEDQRRADVDTWVRIYARVLEFLEKAGGDRDAALVEARNARLAGRDPESLNINAFEVLAGKIELPTWLEVPWNREGEDLSEPSDTPELAVAAHEEDESIAGEAEKLSGQ